MINGKMERIFWLHETKKNSIRVRPHPTNHPVGLFLPCFCVLYPCKEEWIDICLATRNRRHRILPRGFLFSSHIAHLRQGKTHNPLVVAKEAEKIQKGNRLTNPEQSAKFWG